MVKYFKFLGTIVLYYGSNNSTKQLDNFLTYLRYFMITHEVSTEFELTNSDWQSLNKSQLHFLSPQIVVLVVTLQLMWW